MKCFICTSDSLRGPAGLGKYRAVKDIGVIEDSGRRMSPTPRKPTLVLSKETTTAKHYYCPECFMSVVVRKS